MAILTREQAESCVRDMETFEAGGTQDVSLSNGPLVSSKDAYVTFDEGTNKKRYWVLHNIDGTETEFSREAFVEMLCGQRSTWAGDIEPPSQGEDVYVWQ